MTDADFERIVRTHGEALARVAWGYVGGAADHDDLVQDILVAIWRALPRFRGESSERTFIFRIAHNRGITFVSRHRQHEPLPPDAELVDPRPQADERLVRAADRERLVAAIRTLPEAQRQAVILRLEGFSLTEIAALQGVNENNVSVRITRARERLAALLGTEER